MLNELDDSYRESQPSVLTEDDRELANKLAAMACVYKHGVTDGKLLCDVFAEVIAEHRAEKILPTNVMSKHSHTPGPWSTSGEFVPDNIAIMWNSDEAEAIARLMAAAPELLAACECALSVVRTMEMEYGRPGLLVRNLEAAISKATKG